MSNKHKRNARKVVIVHQQINPAKMMASVPTNEELDEALNAVAAMFDCSVFDLCDRSLEELMFAFYYVCGPRNIHPARLNEHLEKVFLKVLEEHSPKQ